MKTNRHHLLFEREWYLQRKNDPQYEMRTHVAFIHVARIAIHRTLHSLMLPPPMPHDHVAREVLDAIGTSNASDAVLRDHLLQDALFAMNDIADTSRRPEIAENAHDLHEHLTMQRRILRLGSTALEAIERRDLDMIAPSDQQHLLRLPRVRVA